METNKDLEGKKCFITESLIVKKVASNKCRIAKDVKLTKLNDLIISNNDTRQQMC